MKFKTNILMTIATLAALAPAAASASPIPRPAPAGRIVIFADKKEGEFKSDKSIRLGTNELVEELKRVNSIPGVHACFIGQPDVIKNILAGMIKNSNKNEGHETLSLKAFEHDAKQSTINLQVVSSTGNDVMINMQIGPC